VDVESYYKANVSRYEEPQAMEVAVIQIPQGEDAAATLGKIKSADDFTKLASQRKPKPPRRWRRRTATGARPGRSAVGRHRQAV